jgi:hypothetical protein
MGLLALELDPEFLATGTVGRVLSLAHETFEAELAGVAECLLAIAFEIFDVGKNFRRTGQKCLKLAFPLDVGPLPQVPTVEIQQVESQIHNTLGVLPTQLTAQRLKVGNTFRAHDHCFTVEDRLTRPKLARCFCDRGKPTGPVITAAGIDGDVLVIDVGLGPVTVGFDFVEPLVSRRGLFPKGRVAKFDESRRRQGVGSQARFS